MCGSLSDSRDFMVPSCWSQGMRLKSDTKIIELRAHGGWLSLLNTEVCYIVPTLLLLLLLLQTAQPSPSSDI